MNTLNGQREKVRVNLILIPGHSEIEGNEVAHQLAWSGFDNNWIWQDLDLTISESVQS